uniref:Uncharacterized protein n=1 Tax=Utricularia reniformis TaxID=192314 RepID=A0A1Y0B0B9_9LAMI|nr:hypothetical protein AEK19_MT0568 [Utricularia reniformis]ART30824.1 hypothetical protein AEK19_MT0568 [Utricularia reniformis]
MFATIGEIAGPMLLVCEPLSKNDLLLRKNLLAYISLIYFT